MFEIFPNVQQDLTMAFGNDGVGAGREVDGAGKEAFEGVFKGFVADFPMESGFDAGDMVRPLFHVEHSWKIGLVANQDAFSGDKILKVFQGLVIGGLTEVNHMEVEIGLV